MSSYSRKLKSNVPDPPKTPPKPVSENTGAPAQSDQSTSGQSGDVSLHRDVDPRYIREVFKL